MPRSKAGIFWPVLFCVVLLDMATKYWAVSSLTRHFPRPSGLGDWLRWTLVYNPGAAFGFTFGSPHSRWIFMGLTLVALGILIQLYASTHNEDRFRGLSLSLVCAGAVGNLLDRIFRGSQGVVDFIDVGIGLSRWPTFNIADMAVSTGAFSLAWVLWNEDRATAASNATAEEANETVFSSPDASAGRTTLTGGAIVPSAEAQGSS